jgi:hypothetical protein
MQAWLIDTELYKKLSSASYSEEQLKKLIDFVWSLDDKHPSFWTGICKTLIITMMRDRLEFEILRLKMTQALYFASKGYTR